MRDAVSPPSRSSVNIPDRSALQHSSPCCSRGQDDGTIGRIATQASRLARPGRSCPDSEQERKARQVESSRWSECFGLTSTGKGGYPQVISRGARRDFCQGGQGAASRHFRGGATSPVLNPKRWPDPIVWLHRSRRAKNALRAPHRRPAHFGCNLRCRAVGRNRHLQGAPAPMQSHMT